MIVSSFATPGRLQLPVNNVSENKPARNKLLPTSNANIVSVLCIVQWKVELVSFAKPSWKGKYFPGKFLTFIQVCIKLMYYNKIFYCRTQCCEYEHFPRARKEGIYVFCSLWALKFPECASKVIFFVFKKKTIL